MTLAYKGTIAIYNTYGHIQLDDASHSIGNARDTIFYDGNFKMLRFSMQR